MIYKFDTPIQLFGQTIFTLNGLIQYAQFYSGQLKKLNDTIDIEVEKRIQLIKNEGILKRLTNLKADNYWRKKYLKLKNRVFTKYRAYESANGIKVLVPRDIHESPKEAVEQLRHDLNWVITAIHKAKWDTKSVDSEEGPGRRYINNPYKQFVKDYNKMDRELFKNRNKRGNE